METKPSLVNLPFCQAFRVTKQVDRSGCCIDMGEPTHTLVPCWIPKPLPLRNQCMVGSPQPCCIPSMCIGRVWRQVLKYQGLSHLFLHILNLLRMGTWHALLARRRVKNGEWRKLIVRRFDCKASIFTW